MSLFKRFYRKKRNHLLKELMDEKDIQDLRNGNKVNLEPISEFGIQYCKPGRPKKGSKCIKRSAVKKTSRPKAKRSAAKKVSKTRPRPKRSVAKRSVAKKSSVSKPKAKKSVERPKISVAKKSSVVKSPKRSPKQKTKKEIPANVKDHNIYKPERGCTEQSNKKYSTRPGPPYPANLCRDEVKTGNDGLRYKSVGAMREGKRYYKWVKI
jgi:hypothetical protein